MARDYANWINGESVTTSKQFDDTNPVDGTLVARVHEAGQAEVDAAVQAARRALAGPWGKLSVAQRSELLYKVAAGIEKRFDEFLAAEIADTGKPKALASHLDIPRGAANFRVFADLVKNVPTEFFEGPAPDGRPTFNYTKRKPKGVVAVVCPWNLPLLLMTWKVAPALACGNCVVVKPSEETPGTATLLGEVMAEAGVPSGVYNVVHGFGPGSAGEFLTTHPGVDAITFTGETRTGAAIMRASAGGIKPVSMELGGKNPAVIFADAPAEALAVGLKRSVFENTGQVCLGTERIYVHRSRFDEVVDLLAKLAAECKPGENFGPLISKEHQQKVLSYYAKAKAEGARVVTGGGLPEMPAELAKGSWIQPTIWTGLPESSPIIREEIFGPCAHVTPFDDEDAAIAMANDTPYGLAASVYTSDLTRAHRVAAQMNVGICWVNCWFVRDLRTAFGGSKMSGIGREGGVHSLEFYTELTNICVKL
ncbi:MAG: 2-hydroxymuconic semialdehyde dehydrogenase [Kofleriaceae bacterium]